MPNTVTITLPPQQAEAILSAADQIRGASGRTYEIVYQPHRILTTGGIEWDGLYRYAQQWTDRYAY